MIPFFKNYSQEQIINACNLFLKSNLIELELNKDGICNGLVHLALEYYFSEKNAEFLDDIYTTTLNPNDDPTIEKKILELLTNFFILYKPDNYHFDISQNQTYTLLKSKPQLNFNFGMILPLSSWIQFFDEIELQDNEVATIANHNHIIMLTKKDGCYKIYDPNEASGEISIKSNKELIQTFFSEIFDDQLFHQDLGLEIKIFEPKDTTKSFKRDIHLFYKNFVNDETKNKKFSSPPYTHQSFKFALSTNNPICLEYFDIPLEQEMATIFALRADKILKEYLKKSSSIHDSLKQQMICHSLFYGCHKMFDLMMEDKSFQIIFQNIFLSTNKFLILNKAIQGKNIDLFLHILDQCIQNDSNNPYHSLNKTLVKFQCDQRQLVHLLKTAIENNQYQMLESLLAVIKQNNISFYQEEIESLILCAIKQNNYLVLEKLLSGTKPHQLSTLHIDILTIEKMSLNVYKLLQSYDFNFDKSTEEMLHEKELAEVEFISFFKLYLFIFIAQISRLFLETSDNLNFQEKNTSIPSFT